MDAYSYYYSSNLGQFGGPAIALSLIALIFAIIEIVFAYNRCKENGKTASILIAFFVILFSIASFVIAIFDFVESEIYGLVAIGIGSFAFLLSIVCLCVVIFTAKKQQEDLPTLKRHSHPNYIEEIKQLKGLLDMGAITQEEYDLKKNEILGKE